MRTVLLVCLLLAGASTASARELYCRTDGSLNWNVAGGHFLARADDEHGHSGWSEFWVDLESGVWRGRNIGSRALYSDGGTYRIASDGTHYRNHWVGVEDDANSQTLRLGLDRKPITFIRLDSDGFAEIGTCLFTADRQFIDGQEVTQ